METRITAINVARQNVAMENRKYVFVLRSTQALRMMIWLRKL